LKDTYLPLSAVDAAVMVIDAARSLKPYTQAVFEVCRLRVFDLHVHQQGRRRGSNPLELWMDPPSSSRFDLAPERGPRHGT